LTAAADLQTGMFIDAGAGRVAIVTGGGTGIGFAICRRLRADGARLVLAGLTDADFSAALARLGAETGQDTSEDTSQNTSEDTSEDTVQVTGFAGDLSVPGVADDLLRHASGTFGRVDILVNNAGGGVIAPTLAHTEETMQATLASDGITVNVVAPSYTRTSELDAVLAAGRAPERFGQVLGDAIALIPVGRGAEADEVAAAVAFLAREDSWFITGQILSVNGGSSMS
jgi:2,3-dihydroxy-2,3-dihydro-p-cumate dehydrogenase